MRQNAASCGDGLNVAKTAKFVFRRMKKKVGKGENVLNIRVVKSRHCEIKGNSLPHNNISDLSKFKEITDNMSGVAKNGKICLL